MKPRLLLIDNYDSFTYNLVQAFLVLGADVRVHRNDEITVSDALASAPSHLCISPGPCTPYDAGVSMDMIRAFAGRVPVLGVCLGHQSMIEVFGGKVVRAQRLMHGTTSAITHDGRTLFKGLPQPCEVGRYHSLIAAPDRMPPELEVSAVTAEGEIMGARHRTLMVEGVQFHPESILTPDGPQLLKNFLLQSGGERTYEWRLESRMQSLRKSLERLLERRHLTEGEAEELLGELTQPDAPPAVAGAVLAALRVKGVVADEVRGFAQGMRRLARRPRIPADVRAIDVVGTGGDGSGSFNISTGTALLAAACGLPVVKHGNRSISSRAGSADVLEALGLALPLDEEAAPRCLAAAHFTFLFAPYYHPAMKALAPVRSALGVRTIFNILGPLTNPAEPALHVIGAPRLEESRLIADTLAGMPIERAFVIHGAEGWDEPTPMGPFTLFDVHQGRVAVEVRSPTDYGLATCTSAGLAGGDARHNASALRAVFTGEDRGPHRDCLLLGAALALEVAGETRSHREAVEQAAQAIDSGAARRVLDAVASFSHPRPSAAS